MAVYPKFDGPEELALPSTLNVHDFFFQHPPSQWEPSVFATKPTTQSMDQFMHGLYKINKRGGGPVERHAGKCLAFLRTEIGKTVIAAAQGTLSLRLEQEAAAKSSHKYDKAV
ncbi:hypothetical protein BGZ58_000552 [Dissophora ornata]|nr:hypothetical protein BGZ58_000552 [Dissophora ornata]